MVLLVFVLYTITFFIMLTGKQRPMYVSLAIAFCFHAGYFIHHLSVVLKLNF
ncbi:MAG: hypothetical protein AAF699_15900 [Pseudomonadota bacterium]